MQQLNRLTGYLRWLKTEHTDKKTIQETYNMLASTDSYDSIVGFDRRSETLAKLVEHEDFKNKTILDLACGTGAFIEAVISRNPKKVVGVDLSSEMLKVARKRFSRFKNLTLINESFMDVTFKKNEFDFVLLANAARYIPQGEEDRFLKNVKQWLRPDGTLILLSDDIFGKSFLGRLLSPLMLLFLDKTKVNPNTANHKNLEKNLLKYFVIVQTQDVVWNVGARVTHKAFFCKLKS